MLTPKWPLSFAHTVPSSQNFFSSPAFLVCSSSLFQTELKCHFLQEACLDLQKLDWVPSACTAPPAPRTILYSATALSTLAVVCLLVCPLQAEQCLCLRVHSRKARSNAERGFRQHLSAEWKCLSPDGRTSCLERSGQNEVVTSLVCAPLVSVGL